MSRMPRLCIVLLMALTSLVSMAQEQAQGLRDPTVPPAAAGLAQSGAVAQPATLESGGIAVVVRQGKPYLVIGTRLYAQGQKFGQTRIERITETEVWLREAGALRKVSVFSGIERRAALAPGTSSTRVKPLGLTP